MKTGQQVARLQEVATAALKRKRLNQAELAQAIDESAGTVTNWKSRGIPKAKILELSRRFRCNADYIEFGTPPAFFTKQEDVPKAVAQAVAAFGDVELRNVVRLSDEACKVALMWDQLPDPLRVNLFNIIEFTLSAAKMRARAKSP